MTAERMNQNATPRAVSARAASQSFNAANNKTASELVIRDRAAKAVERLSARHEANEARLVAQRFTKLLKADRNEPALKPSWAVDDKRSWLHRAAKYQVAREFEKRIDRVNKVADRMIANKSAQKNLIKQRDALER
ncbi:MAG: hypothetical protein HC788_09810 [Sphingopyxis sp.]|nr:hypothetical protein [Sphingopyxis sp.]